MFDKKRPKYLRLSFLKYRAVVSEMICDLSSGRKQREAILFEHMKNVILSYYFATIKWPQKITLYFGENAEITK